MPSHRDYKFGKQLGRGSFGVVHKVERKADGCVFVCKEIVLRGLRPKERDEASQEVELLRKISKGSSYIVQYVESFVERESLHIIMEFCEHGDLSDFLKARAGQHLEEASVWKFALQIGLGLSWLHANRILHRDIKSLNVFLTARDDARLGDLGVARVLSAGASFASTLIGTPYYLSPEICDSKPYNDRSDVWAYGCVLYEMCAFKHPFDARNQMALLAKIAKGKYAPIPEMYSSDLHLAVASCLELDYARRPAIADLLALPAARSWANKVGIPVEKEEEEETVEQKAEARRRLKRVHSKVARLHDDAVKDLDAPTRLVWDSLYRLLRAKMAHDLTEEDQKEVERYIFEELPPEHTDLISKACKILPLQQECDRLQEVLGSSSTGACGDASP